MTSERWYRLQALFGEARARPPQAREAFIEAACGDDGALAAELRALLAQDAQGDDPVAQMVERAAGVALAGDEIHRAWIGRRLGAWRITAHLADGGMGAVYRAERADGQYQQQAAIKLINPAFVAGQAADRLAAERQILARLEHPHIARLLDGGSTDDGAPYLVMEYVDGTPIDTYCNVQGLDTAARLRLFQQVCSAVDYAHRNLVVHRDLKPANILVDRDGQPKLLDFGIAKLVEGAEATLTAANQRVLTPTHASPEQIRGEPVTTSTDVYALGVLLYELLAGRLPYVADEKTPGSAALLARQILESEPRTPSAAVTQGSNERIEAARRRGAQLTPERLRRELQGDLDNIVLMALRKEPQRRYTSAQALREDIDRFLSDRAVRARPDHWTYHGAKLLKRRRGVVIAAALVIAAVSAQSAFLVQRILAERNAAQLARVQAENVVGFLEDLLQGADRFASAGREVTVRDVLERGAQRIESELATQPVEQARLMHVIASSYVGLSLNEAALPLAQRSLELRRAALGPTHVETLESMRTVGIVTSNNGDPQAAQTILEETLRLQQQHLDPDSPELAATLQELGVVKRVLGKPSEALADQRAAFAILSRLPPTHDQYRFLPRVMNQIGNALDATGDRTGAIDAYRQALELFERTGQSDDPVVGSAMHNIGLSLQAAGKPQDALPYLHRALEHTRRTLGELTTDFEVQAASLGRVYAQLRRFDEAEQYAQLGLQTAVRLYGAAHQYYAYNLVNLARLRQLQGRHADALPLLRQAIDIYRATFGPYHRFLAAAEVGQAESLAETGRAREAATRVAAVLARMHADPEFERHVEAVARSVQGRALGLSGQTERARGLLTEALKDLRALVGDDHTLTAEAARRLVSFLDAQGERATADPFRVLLPAAEHARN